jgi:hypothetical protein
MGICRTEDETRCQAGTYSGVSYRRSVSICWSGYIHKCWPYLEWRLLESFV